MKLSFIGIHLDLKYVMPRQNALHRFAREAAAMGINTLVLEYEDKFPFEKYPFLRDPEAFKPDQLRAFLKVAREAGLRVVPLVQTLSHLEFALGHDELAHLREAPDIPTQLCPSNPGAQEFVRDLIDEILAYHQDDEFVHLGADETWFLGVCPQCAALKHELGTEGMWARHLLPLIQHARAAGKRAIVWDDVLWPKPECLDSLGLPSDLVLNAWDYAMVQAPGSASERRVAHYRSRGFDVLGSPCLNWGVLYPMHNHSLRNTAAWAQLAREQDCLGVVNTTWASFHTLLPTMPLYIGATAASFQPEPAKLDEAWQSQFLAEWFGANADGLSTALEELGTNWEYPIAGQDRPITPLVYGSMDMILHYPGGQSERRQRGSYPLDREEIDFAQIYRQKLDLLRAAPDLAAVLDHLGELENTYAGAQERLTILADTASAHREEAGLLALFASMKRLHAQLLLLFLAGSGDVVALTERLHALRPELEEALAPFVEPRSLAFLLKIWWQPAAVALEAYSSISG